MYAANVGNDARFAVVDTEPPEPKDRVPVLFITTLGVFSSVRMQCDEVLTP